MEAANLEPILSVLIANRGEIAVRIIKTCRKMGIRTIAVFSDADQDAMFVRMADEAHSLGGNEPSETYLDGPKILQIASNTFADAIHPGYGFLSENAQFARDCREYGHVFIGPDPKAIEAMGSKSAAKQLMMEHGVPVVPGYNGKNQAVNTFLDHANRIGFPVLLKASAGGGGKGMRIVNDPQDMQKELEAAKRESLKAFGDDHIILEKYIASARHIEFQIFGDMHGNIIHLHERECTIQRRYQKIIEESPSPALDENLRAQMAEAAIQAAKAIQYYNAGTVEFIFDNKEKQFYFLEMNTRLQVEHPVTEAITGLDLVEMQIQVAEGRPLNLSQGDIQPNGYAIECRVYAEDPTQDFFPQTGKLHLFEWPELENLRVDSGVQTGDEVSVYYDPMLAKLITWGKDKAEAVRKMGYVLQQMVCLGVTTNQNLLAQILRMQSFLDGNYDTGFIAGLELTKDQEPEQIWPYLLAANLFDWSIREKKRTLLRQIPSGWRNNFYQAQETVFFWQEEEYALRYRHVNGRQFKVFFAESEVKVELLHVSKSTIQFKWENRAYRFRVHQHGQNFFLFNSQKGPQLLKCKDRFPENQSEEVKGGYEAPMPSQVIEVLVEEGQTVEAGTPLVILSSMKMENRIEAIEPGVVEAIFIQAGQNIQAGQALLKIQPAEKD